MYAEIWNLNKGCLSKFHFLTEFINKIKLLFQLREEFLLNVTPIFLNRKKDNKKTKKTTIMEKTYKLHGKQNNKKPRQVKKMLIPLIFNS